MSQAAASCITNQRLSSFTCARILRPPKTAAPPCSHERLQVSYALPAEIVTGLLGVVPALEKARLYRGRGGELMRQAACRVVECLALTKPDVAIKTQVSTKSINMKLYVYVSAVGTASTKA